MHLQKKCDCNGLRDMNEYNQVQYVMVFLIGLHEAYAQIRAQLLLMDLIPPINRVFVFVIQKERHRKMGVKFTGESRQVISLVVGSKEERIQWNMGIQIGERNKNGNNSTLNGNNHGNGRRA